MHKRELREEQKKKKKDTMSQPIWFPRFGSFTEVCQDAQQTQNTFY